MKHLAPVIALLLTLLPLVPAQAQSASLDALDIRTDAFPRIVVRLRDSPDAPAALQPDQLRVLENGQAQPSADVRQLRNPAVPTSIALAIDVSGSTAAQSAAKAFTSQLRPIDKVVVVGFADDVIVPQPLTADRQLVARTIDLLAPGTKSRLYDGVAQGLTQLSLAPNGTRALVVLTDGKDSASERLLSDDIAQAVQLAVPIYAIGLGPDADTKVLQQFAAESGGQYFAAPTSRDLTDAFRLISHQLGAEYQISWVSNSTITSNTDIPVQINLARSDGSQTSADLSYTPPAFAIRTAQTSPIQVLREVAPTMAPSEQQALMAGSLAGIGVFLLAFGLARRRSGHHLESRLTTYVADRPTVDQSPTILTLRPNQLSPVTATTATFAARLYPRNLATYLRRRLTQAGYPADRHLAIFLATEAALAAMLGSLTYTLLSLKGIATGSPLALIFFAGLAALFGGYLPYMWLRRQADARQRRVLRALPDALDLMVISVTAGLSLDTAMSEVVQKWDGDLSREFNHVLNEMRMGVSRRTALRNFADRTNLEDVRLLVAALLQADEIGSNISVALSTQADQLRVRRHHQAKEKAQKAPIKMLIPMVLFIFPAMFAVILAPAFIQIIDVLGSMAKG